MDSYEKLLQVGFQPNGALTEQEIENLEARIQFKMPQDYRQFMLKSNGGSVPRNVYYWVHANNLPEEEIEIKAFLGINPEEKVVDLSYWFDAYGYEYEGINTAQIALSDPGVIVLGYENDPRDGVYLWDDSLELETSTEDNCMYKIADSFEEFVSKIYVEEI